MSVRPRRVIVFGATGNAGRRLVACGLALGHTVTAFVRDRDKLARQWRGTPPPELRVVEGDVLDEAAVGAAIAGHDAVVNAAGHVNDGAAFTRLCALVVRQAEKRMAEPRRVWLFGGAAALDLPGTSWRGVDLPGMPAIYQAHRANWRMLEKSSTEWSLACPGPMVAAPDGQPRGGLRIAPDIVPISLGGWAGFAPRIALALAFKAHLPEITVPYEDVAELVMTHLDPGGPFARKRVGLALPAGETLTKSGWRPGARSDA
jgi:uncharacterized protein